MSITGGLAGGALAAWLGCRKSALSFRETFAVMSPAVLLAQVVGRIGCFLNGDSYGLNSDLPWAVEFPRYGTLIPGFEKVTTISSSAWGWSFENGLVDLSSTVSAPLHPTQLYEAVGDLVLMVAVLFSVNRVQGHLTIIFIHTGGYALLRFLIEFVKPDRSISLQIILASWVVFSVASALSLVWLDSANDSHRGSGP